MSRLSRQCLWRNQFRKKALHRSSRAERAAECREAEEVLKRRGAPHLGVRAPLQSALMSSVEESPNLDLGLEFSLFAVGQSLLVVPQAILFIVLCAISSMVQYKSLHPHRFLGRDQKCIMARNRTANGKNQWYPVWK